MKTAIIWCRTSTDKQEWETQKKDLLKVAVKDGFTEEKGNLIIIGEQGASAIKMNELYQREVNQLLSTINTVPDISRIYVWEISRLARNKMAFQQMEEAIIEKRIQLVSNVPSLKLFDEDEDGNVTEVNQGSEITFDLLITLAKQEMEIKIKRFSRGKERLAEQGKYNGGAIPYGYKINTEKDGLIEEDEEEGAIVREIYQMYENGMSQPSIAKEMFARGVKGRAARKTKSFTISLVHQILTNELLTGKPHKSKGATHIRQYPQIITPEQFQKCRKIAEMNNTVLPKSRRVYYAHQLIECTECKRKFVGTGGKGYYHCWDAYNYNKKYDGYDGVPMCTNRVCISTNIMDSLLWKLAIKYETFFILNEANDRIATYENRIKVLQKKIDNIPTRLQAIDQNAEKLNKVYVLGGTMKDEQFRDLQAAIRRERSEVIKEKTQYLREVEHFKALQEQALKAMALDYETDPTLTRAQAVYRKVSTITDDHERSDIIHRHIEKVTLEKTTITQTFGIHPDGKEVFAKKITIYPFGKDKEVYFFVPYDGKGGHMLTYQDYERAYMYLDNPRWRIHGNRFHDQTPTMLPFEMEYLPRIKDEGKYRRRELARTNRENLKSEAIDKLRKQGYISMNEMRLLSKLSYSTIYDAIKQERLKGKNLFKTWYAKKKDFLKYLDKYKPQPRLARQKYGVYQEPSNDNGEE